MATSQEGIPIPNDRALTELRVFGKEWGPLLVSAVTVLGAFAAGLGWIDSRMGSRMDRMEERIGRIEARLDNRLEEFEARMEARFEQRFAEIDARFAEIDARFETMDRRFLRLEEAVRDIAERLARVEGHLGISPPGGERDGGAAALRATPAARATPPTRRTTGRPAPTTPRCSEWRPSPPVRSGPSCARVRSGAAPAGPLAWTAVR